MTETGTQILLVGLDFADVQANAGTIFQIV